MVSDMSPRIDPGYELLAAQYIRRQVKQLADQFAGVCAAEDIEFVHRARVATRRLRAGLRIFDDCFPARRARRWRKALRRVTRELGEARDCDVQIDYLCGVLAGATSKTCFPAIARLLVGVERRRERLQRRVVRALEHLKSAGVLREMRRATKKMLSAGESAAGQPAPAACQGFERHIVRRWAELRQHQSSLADPSDQDGHHAMRIAAKRLRYTVEIARPLYGGQLDEALNAIKQVQSELGEVHDCDVWVVNLDRFAAEERQRIETLFGHGGPFGRLNAGIDYLRRDRQDRRRQVFGELVEYWQRLQGESFWEGMLAVVYRDGGRGNGSGGTASLPPRAGQLRNGAGQARREPPPVEDGGHPPAPPMASPAAPPPRPKPLLTAGS